MKEIDNFVKTRYEDIMRYAIMLARFFELPVEDAKDCVGDAFKQLVSLQDTIEDKGRYQWMRQIIANCLKNKKKRKPLLSIEGNFQNVQNIMDKKTPDPADSDEILEKEMKKKREVKALKDCISLLKKNWQTIIYLRFYEEMSYEEISKILSIPKGTLRTAFLRSKQALKKCLQKKGIKE